LEQSAHEFAFVIPWPATSHLTRTRISKLLKFDPFWPKGLSRPCEKSEFVREIAKKLYPYLASKIAQKSAPFAGAKASILSIPAGAECNFRSFEASL
jgi:hypothetical protein